MSDSLHTVPSSSDPPPPFPSPSLPSESESFPLLFIKRSSSVTTIETPSSSVLFTLSTLSSPRPRILGGKGTTVELVRGIGGRAGEEDVVVRIRGNKAVFGRKEGEEKERVKRVELLVFQERMSGPRTCFRNEADNRIYRFDKAPFSKSLTLVAKADRTPLITFSPPSSSSPSPSHGKTVLFTMSLLPASLLPDTPYHLLDLSSTKPTALLEEALAAYLVFKGMRGGGLEAVGTAASGAGAAFAMG